MKKLTKLFIRVGGRTGLSTGHYASGYIAWMAGLHLGYNGNFNKTQSRDREQNFKIFRSPGYFLQFENI